MNRILIGVTVLCICGIAGFGVYAFNEVGETTMVFERNEAEVVLNNETPAVPKAALPDDELEIVAEDIDEEENDPGERASQDESVEETEQVKKVDLVSFPNSYTNTFIPDLNIRYSDDWQFNTTTESSRLINNLLERTITLKKGGTTITFELLPEAITGCFTSEEESRLEEFKSDINGSGISRYDSPKGAGDIYAPSKEKPFRNCGIQQLMKLSSTLRKSNLKGTFPPEGELLQYWLKVNVTGTEFIEEADELIGASQLQS